MEVVDFWPASSKRGIEELVASVLNGRAGLDELLGLVVARAESTAAFMYRADRLPQFSAREGEAFRERLRVLVEDWIESGIVTRVEDGVVERIENPWRRAVPDDQIQEFWSKSTSYVSQGSDGQIRVKVLPEFSLDSKTWAIRLAFSYFARLLDSPRRECVSRCMECKRFFVRQRLPRREAPTTLGTYCPGHRDLRKARGVYKARDSRRKTLLRLASQLLPRYGRQRKDWEDWLVEQMNNELMKHPKYHSVAPATKKWITRNRKAILERVGISLATKLRAE